MKKRSREHIGGHLSLMETKLPRLAAIEEDVNKSMKVEILVSSVFDIRTILPYRCPPTPWKVKTWHRTIPQWTLQSNSRDWSYEGLLGKYLRLTIRGWQRLSAWTRNGYRTEGLEEEFSVLHVSKWDTLRECVERSSSITSFILFRTNYAVLKWKIGN